MTYIHHSGCGTPERARETRWTRPPLYCTVGIVYNLQQHRISHPPAPTVVHLQTSDLQTLASHLLIPLAGASGIGGLCSLHDRLDSGVR